MRGRRLVLLAGALALALLAGALLLRRGSPSGPALRVAALVGDSTPDDRAVRQGLVLAARALESERGGSPIELVLRDPHGDETTAAEQLRALEASGVRFVADVVGDDLIKACSPVFRQTKLVGTLSTSTPALQGACGPRVLRVASWGAEDARALADWARELRPRRAMSVHRDDAAGRRAQEAFDRGMASHGGARGIPVADAGAQASWVAERLREGQPDVVALLLPAPDALQLLAAAGDAVPPVILAPDAQLGRALADRPELRARVRFVLPEAAPENPGREAFLAAWRASGATGEPDPRALVAWDALHVLARAAWNAAGDPDRALELAKSSASRGATGRLAFTGDGERVPAPWRRMLHTKDGIEVPYLPESGS